MEATYSIRAAAEETGIPAHTIRAWERRYAVLSPERTGTNRRMYDAEDLRRLKHLRRAVESGHSIGMIAALPLEELARLARPEPAALPRSETAESMVAAALKAIRDLDATAIEATLVRATVLLGIDALVDDVAVPLLQAIGHGWELGTVGIAQEHLFTAVMRTHFERTRLSIQPPPGSPRIVVATPSGQLHELGAILASVVAARMEWDVTYLGPNLPAADIAAAAQRVRASAVAISLVYPADDPGIPAEIKALRAELSPGVDLLVGGAAADAYRNSLKEVGAIEGKDLRTLRNHLASLASRLRP